MSEGVAPDPRHVAVVLNGEFGNPRRLLAVMHDADVVVAADGGANWLVQQRLTPDVVVGDMDSLDPELASELEAHRTRLVRHSCAKDQTDAELALLEAVDQGARRITVLGALGGRIDHALANVHLLLMPQLSGVHTVLFDGASYLWVTRDQTEISGVTGDVVSLIPLAGDATGVETDGLAYPLCGETLHCGAARGVSNILSGPIAHVTLRSGVLLVVFTPSALLNQE